MRNFVIEILQTSLPNFCDAAAILSADLFDEIAEALGVDVETNLFDTIDYDKVEQKVRYFAKFLNDGDAEKFKQEVANVTRYYVKRSAFDNMRENCKGQAIKWARVPTGFETCAFCFMLASRGFVYGNEKLAGKDRLYHQNCDCIIIPGFEDENGNPRVKIDGYDPETMYENWCKCAKTVGIDTGDGLTKLSEADVKAIQKEVETRDWHWLYTGEKPKLKFQNSALRKEIMSERAHEVGTASILARNGVHAKLVVDHEYYFDEKTGEKKTKGLADLANGFELKTLGVDKDKGASTYNTINGYIKQSSKKKRNMKAIVFDNSRNDYMDDDKLIEYINKSQSFRRGRIYIIDHDGKYRFIR